MSIYDPHIAQLFRIAPTVTVIKTAALYIVQKDSTGHSIVG